jgi:hypothetical protein
MSAAAPRGAQLRAARSSTQRKNAQTDVARLRCVPAPCSRCASPRRRAVLPPRDLNLKKRAAGPLRGTGRRSKFLRNRCHCFATSRRASIRKNSSPNDAASPELAISRLTTRIGPLAAPLRRSYPLPLPSRYAPEPVPANDCAGMRLSKRDPPDASSRRSQARRVTQLRHVAPELRRWCSRALWQAAATLRRRSAWSADHAGHL